MLSGANFAAVIVAYHCDEVLAIAVESVLSEAPDAVVVVIDNDSVEPSSLARIRSMSDRIVYERLGDNYGFSTAVNVGIRHAITQGALYICLLNPDAELRPGWFAGMCEHYSAHTDLSVVSPMQLSTRDGGISPWANNALSLGSRVDSQTIRVPWLEASALFVRVETFWEVGLFDERFFLYYEDKEFCRRLAASGIGCLITSRASYTHAGGGSFGDPGSLYRQALLDKGNMLYSATDGRLGSWQRIHRLVLLFFRRLAQNLGRRGYFVYLASIFEYMLVGVWSDRSSPTGLCVDACEPRERV